MARPELTEELARRAANDAANARMRAEGRAKWNREDAHHAVRTFLKLYPNAGLLPRGGHMTRLDLLRAKLERTAAQIEQEYVCNPTMIADALHKTSAWRKLAKAEAKARP